VKLASTSIDCAISRRRGLNASKSNRATAAILIAASEDMASMLESSLQLTRV
jgi:hypothetical protein